MPVCSVVTTVFDPTPEHLQACLDSVREQTVADIEHVLVDDRSTQPHVAELLAAAAAADSRVRVISRSDNGGIVAASNDGLDAATGEFVALLDHDDVIEADAIETMIDALIETDADVAYSDHDLLVENGRFCEPTYKPDFSPEQLRNQNYILHFVVARRQLLHDVGGFRAGFDGAQDHDLLLRLAERTVAEAEHRVRFVHVPRVLYHWRQSAASVSTDAANKTWAFDAGLRAVQEHCDRIGIRATVTAGPVAGSYRLARTRREATRVSVVIPTRGTARRVWGVERCFVVEAVRSLVDNSTTDDCEFVIVYDDDTPDPVLHALRRIAGEQLTLVRYSEEWNFSRKINVGVAASSGPLLLILNDDTELIEPSSIETLAAHLDDPTVGMVGPKLLFADGTIQDGGHVYNGHLLPGMPGWHGDSAGPGQLRPLAVEREVSGVTAAAAMTTREIFDEVGGFDESIPVNFNDVDLCLRIRATGRRIIWTPQSSWYHFESQTRPPSAAPEEFFAMDDKWHDEINNDPYYNPNLTPYRADWLERPFRSGEPRHDPDDTTSRWMLQRITGKGARADGALVNRLRLLGFATLFALAVFVHRVASASDAPIVGQLAFTWGPWAMVLVAVAVAVFRQRWILAAGIVVAFGPLSLVVLVQGTLLSALFGVALFTGVAIGPALQAGRAIASAVLAGVLAVATVIWVLAEPVGSDFADRVGQPAIVTWAIGLTVFAAAVLVSGSGRSLVVVVAAIIGLAVAASTQSSVSSWIDISGIWLLAGAIVFAASRVEGDPVLGRRVFIGVFVLVGVSWVLSATGLRSDDTGPPASADVPSGSASQSASVGPARQ